MPKFLADGVIVSVFFGTRLGDIATATWEEEVRNGVPTGHSRSPGSHLYTHRGSFLVCSLAPFLPRRTQPPPGHNSVHCSMACRDKLLPYVQLLLGEFHTILLHRGFLEGLCFGYYSFQRYLLSSLPFQSRLTVHYGYA